MPTIELPNGEIAEFPDNVSIDEIKSIIQKKFPSRQLSLNEKIQNAQDLGAARPLHKTLQDIASGAVKGSQNLGASLLEGGEYLTRKGAERIGKLVGNPVDIPKWNAREFAGLEGENPIDLSFYIESNNPNKLAQITGQYGLAGLKGGANVLRQALTQGIFGATQASPEEQNLFGILPEGRTGAAIENAALAAIPFGVGKAASLAKKNDLYSKILDKIIPGRVSGRVEKEAENVSENISNISKQISQNLGKGATNLEEITPAIANDIREIYDPAVEEAAVYFDHVLNQVNKTKDKGLLYEKANPLISTALDEGTKLMGKVKDLKVGDLGKIFLNEPTFQNAHNLQQELGVMIADLERLPGKTKAEKLELSQIKGARDQLKEDMVGYLKNKYPNQNENLVKPWETGIELYKENVTPLLSTKKLREINRNRKLGVKNIHESFENPEFNNKVLKSGEIQKGQGSKLFDMLSDELKDKILFSKIGALSGEDSTALKKELLNAERKGYSGYKTKRLNKELEELIRMENELKGLEGKLPNLKKRERLQKNIYKILGLGGTGFGIGNELIRSRHG